MELIDPSLAALMIVIGCCVVVVAAPKLNELTFGLIKTKLLVQTSKQTPYDY
jgi:hypothetical protein